MHQTSKVLPRYVAHAIAADALVDHKMAFISGPRQVDKTTLGRSFIPSNHNLFSWDETSFRRAWVKDPKRAVANREPGPILLDELHKDRRWKGRLKGLYDLCGHDLPIIVTGSARLDVFRQGGDSLLGRYLPYRLHPFTVAENEAPPLPDEILSRNKARFSVEDLLALGRNPGCSWSAKETTSPRHRSSSSSPPNSKLRRSSNSSIAPPTTACTPDTTSVS